jgi:hypothetical protein
MYVYIALVDIFIGTNPTLTGPSENDRASRPAPTHPKSSGPEEQNRYM